MKKIKTFESFWPFNKKEQLDVVQINDGKLQSIANFLKESSIAKDLLNMKVTSYEVGFSKIVSKKLVIDINSSIYGQFVRFEFTVDDEHFVVNPKRCLFINNSLVIINSDKQRDFEDFENEMYEMLDLQKKIYQQMQKIGLTK